MADSDNQYPTPEDAQHLVERIAAGERDAETELFKCYGAGVLMLLRQRCGDAGMAEDLLQDTFRIVIQRLRDKNLEKPERLAAYLHRVAVNLIIGEMRKIQRRNTHIDLDAVDAMIDVRPDALEQLSKDNLVQLVHKLLDEMPVERDRELLVMHFIEELDKEQVCRRLDLTPAHFDRVLYRAKQRFRVLYERVQPRREE